MTWFLERSLLIARIPIDVSPEDLESDVGMLGKVSSFGVSGLEIVEDGD